MKHSVPALLVLAPLYLALAACAVGPDYKAPETAPAATAAATAATCGRPPSVDALALQSQSPGLDGL